MVTVTIPLVHSDPKKMAERLLKELGIEGGPQIEEGAPGEKTILVRGTPEQIAEIRKTIELIEKGK